jgi:hypothetical protein
VVGCDGFLISDGGPSAPAAESFRLGQLRGTRSGAASFAAFAAAEVDFSDYITALQYLVAASLNPLASHRVESEVNVNSFYPCEQCHQPLAGGEVRH